MAGETIIESTAFCFEALHSLDCEVVVSCHVAYGFLIGNETGISEVDERNIRMTRTREQSPRRHRIGIRHSGVSELVAWY